MLSVINEFTTSMSVVACVDLGFRCDFAIFKQEHITHGLERRTWVNQILEQVVVVFCTFRIRNPLKVRDCLYLAGLALDDSSPTSMGAQLKDAFAKGTVEYVLHFDIDRSVDVGTIDRLLHGNICLMPADDLLESESRFSS